MSQRIQTRIGRLNQFVTRLVHSPAPGVLVLCAALCVPSAASAQTWGDAAVPGVCAGDCNHDGSVTIDELITMINIALGDVAFDACPAGDANADRAIAVDDVIAAAQLVLDGCGLTPTPTRTVVALTLAPTPSVTPTATPTRTFTPASVCGNGRWRDEPGEQCDDGNTTLLDGCDANCQVEPDCICQGQPSECSCFGGCTGGVATCSGGPVPSPTPPPPPPQGAHRPPAATATATKGQTPAARIAPL